MKIDSENMHKYKIYINLTKISFSILQLRYAVSTTSVMREFHSYNVQYNYPSPMFTQEPF